jgi:hypothetical protein
MGLAFSRSLAQSCADRRLATSAARHRALEPRSRRVRSAPRGSGWFGCGAAQLGSVRMPHGSGWLGCGAAQLGSVRRLRTTVPHGAARRDLRVLSSIAASLDPSASRVRSDPSAARVRSAFDICSPSWRAARSAHSAGTPAPRRACPRPLKPGNDRIPAYLGFVRRSVAPGRSAAAHAVPGRARLSSCIGSLT